MRRRRPPLWPVAAVVATPLTPLVGSLLGGWWTFLTPLYMFAILPLLDLVAGPDRLNALPERAEELETDPRFRWYLYIAVALNVLALLFGAWYFAAGASTWLERLGMVLSVGILTGGMGITVAHELFHRKDVLSQALGHTNLLCVAYMHYAIEHLSGHHVRVATPEDPITARRGESLYAYLARVVLDESRSAWEIETRRLARKRLPWWRNRILGFAGLELGFAWVLGSVLGGWAVVFYLLQAVVAIALLETVNYVEHYGLRRREIAPGRYEPVGPACSWDADNRLSNLLLFYLQRHADHHMHARTPYQALQYRHDSPKLPTGYPGMILIAAVPPLWRRVIHPRLERLERELSGH